MENKVFKREKMREGEKIKMVRKRGKIMKKGEEL